MTYKPKGHYDKKHRLPHSLYMQIIWKIKDYDRLKNERLNIIYGTSVGDGQPRGSGTGNPTEQKALKLVYINDQLAGIDQAVVFMRSKYERRMEEGFSPIDAFNDYGYFNWSYLRDEKNETGASERTWRRFRIIFCYQVAENLKMF